LLHDFGPYFAISFGAGRTRKASMPEQHLYINERWRQRGTQHKVQELTENSPSGAANAIP
jgi:hypothetical protein